jgi:capsular polysaccharide biosynthesis protein
MAPERVIEEPCVMLGNNPNYFHWTLEALSRLWCLDILRELSDLPVVVPVNPPPHVIEMLQVLGFSPDRLIFLDKKAIKFRKLYFPSYLAGSAIAARQVEYVRQRLLKGFKVGKTLHGRNRYYLRRSDARVRRISNDDEVVAYLDSLGFESICPGQMTVRQQVEAFAEAEIVVAPHGAGNVNMIYAPADATLVEIMPASSRHPLFWMMTKLAGQKYGRIICQDSPVTQDMTIDMTSFSQLMQKVVGSYQAKFISTSKIGQEYGCIQGPFSGSFSRF